MWNFFFSVRLQLIIQSAIIIMEQPQANPSVNSGTPVWQCAWWPEHSMQFNHTGAKCWMLNDPMTGKSILFVLCSDPYVPTCRGQYTAEWPETDVVLRGFHSAFYNSFRFTDATGKTLWLFVFSNNFRLFLTVFWGGEEAALLPQQSAQKRLRFKHFPTGTKRQDVTVVWQPLQLLKRSP